MSRFLVFCLFFILVVSVGSVCVGQLVSDTSIISMSGSDWSLKVDGVLQSSLDSRNVPYMTSKSVSEKELFLELESFEDCKSGVVQFKVDMAGLTAYKQLPLTQKEINEGSFRPKNVENSFALFDSNGRKVAHIYGSKITDSKGAEIWLDQDLSEGLLTVYLPKAEVLETLSFPLLLDPTFGYTSIGGSNTGLGGSAGKFACRFELTEAATIYNISVYGSGMGNLTAALYSDNAGSINALLNSTNTVDGSALGWHNTTLSSPYIASAGYYWLAAASDALNANGWYYDLGAVNQGIWNWGGTLDDPWGGGTSTNTTISIYADYIAEVEPTPTPSPSPSPSPSPVPSSTTLTDDAKSNAILFVLGFMAVFCLVSLVWFGRVPVVGLVIGLFTVLVGLYCGLGGVYSLGVAQGWFSLFVALFGGLTMLLVGLGVRVRR